MRPELATDRLLEAGVVTPNRARTELVRPRFGLHRPAEWSGQVVLLDARAGSGKTTLAQQVADSFRADGCAVRVFGLREGSVVWSWARLSADLVQAGWFRLDGPDSGLVAEFDAAHGSTRLLVVDDLDALRDPTDFLRRLLGCVAADPGLRLLVICEDSGPVRRILEDLQDGVVVIDSRQLAFTLDETAELLALNAPQASTPSAQDLHCLTHGWALGLRLVLSSLQAGDARAEVLATCARGGFPAARKGDVASLYRLSVPDQFTVELAGGLLILDRAGTERELQRLGDLGLLVKTGERDSARYQVPRLLRRKFRDVFRVRSAGEFRRCCRMTAVDLSLAGHHPKAFEMAVASQDWALVCRIGAEHGLAIIDDYVGFGSICASIPNQVYAQCSLLGVVVSLAMVTNESQFPISSLTEAADRWLASVESSKATDTLDAVVRAMIGFAHDALVSSDVDAAQVDALLRRISLLPPSERQPSNGGLQLLRELVLAAGLLQAGTDFAVEMETLIRSAMSRGDYRLAARTRCHLGLSHAVNGHYQLAASVLHSRVADGDIDVWADRLTLIDHQLAEAVMAMNSLHLTTAKDIVERLIGQYSDVVQVSLLQAVRLRIALLEGDESHRYQMLADPHPGRQSPGSLYRSLYAVTRADLATSVAQFQWAQDLLSDPSLDQIEVAAAKARLFLRRGEPRAALIEASRALSGRRESARIRAAALSVATPALLDLGRKADARQHAEALAAIVATRGHRAVFALIPKNRRREVATLIDADSPALRWLRDDSIPDPFGGAAVAPVLTKRERQLLEALIAGSTLAEVARTTDRSINTVKHQTASLYRKLGVTSRQDAVSVGLSLWSPHQSGSVSFE